MSRFSLSLALLLALALLTGTAYAADPEFKTARVTESHEYERETTAASVAGVRLPPNKEWTNRVTVTLDDERVTGEWSRETSRSATFKDFPRGSNVQAAVTRNQLLLKRPGGSVVTMKIVRRVKPGKDEGERD
jgi:hypothetical protein